MWKARAKNHRDGPGKPKSLLDLLENDLRFSVNHPHFRPPDHETLERIKRLDLLSDLIAAVRDELAS